MSERVSIEISKELKEYLDEVAYDDGVEAWYTEQMKLPLGDYDFTIKGLLNDREMWIALSHGELTCKRLFEVKVDKQ